MAGFGSLKSLVDAQAYDGKERTFTFRKSPTQVTLTRQWFDLSMSPGNPVPQYYAASPGVAIQMKQSTDGGIFHGGNVTPSSKYLRTFCLLANAATALPMPVILLDYLLYYPFIDEGTTDAQTLTNTNTLPRYTDGAGVQIMAVSVAGRTGGQTFQVTYTNQSGTAGRVTSVVKQNTGAVTGTIVTTDGAVVDASSPFLPLQGTDTGVRSIESVQMISGADVGLFTLVLVKPLLQTQIRGIDAAVEADPLLMKKTLPEIKDDAFLGMICLPQGSLAATAIHGYITTTWT
jgi:hypothetical protein